jgi:hypothetical protein
VVEVGDLGCDHDKYGWEDEAEAGGDDIGGNLCNIGGNGAWAFDICDGGGGGGGGGDCDSLSCDNDEEGGKDGSDGNAECIWESTFECCESSIEIGVIPHF